MTARILVTIAAVQVLVMYLPPLNWPLWMLRFAALETCLLPVLLAAIVLLIARDAPWLRVVAALTLIGGAMPAIAIIPDYLREGVHFSITDWLTGGQLPKVTVERDLEIANGLKVDVYHAPGDGPKPWVMVVHGGSWKGGDKGDAPRASYAMAAAGISVVDIQYRLSMKFPAALQDVRCILGRVTARAAEFDLDPDRVALIGRSAGEKLALLAAYSNIVPDCATSLVPVRAVVSVYGPTDLAWDWANPYVPDVITGTQVLEAYLGGTPETAPEAYQQATPMSWLDHDVPPTLILHGTGERCVNPENATRLHAALQAHGQSSKLVLIPFADHGFDIRPGGLGAQLARSVTIAFLKDKLGIDAP